MVCDVGLPRFATIPTDQNTGFVINHLSLSLTFAVTTIEDSNRALHMLIVELIELLRLQALDPEVGDRTEVHVNIEGHHYGISNVEVHPASDTIPTCVEINLIGYVG